MNKIVIVVLVGIIIVTGSIFYFSGIDKNPAEDVQVVSAAAKPWIEVVASGVFELDSRTHAQIRELKTGDELNTGITVETEKNGKANIHFPDGSVARLEPATELTLREAAFDPQSEKLIVKIRLTAGRVWSKIISLATPDSLWEVKTSNAVATVRGTAFGMVFANGTSRVLGSEHAIAVAVIDPKTDNIIPGTDKIVSTDQLVEINNKDIPAIQANPALVTTRAIPAALAGEDFVQKNREADSRLNRKLEELEKTGLDNKESRQKFRESIIEEFSPEIQSRKLELEKETSNEPTSEINDRGISAPVEKPRITTIETNIRQSSESKIISLKVIGKNDLQRIIEGDRIPFEAIASRSDGAEVNVTSSAAWQVLGSIGSIDRDGVFAAKLGLQVAEFGESSGSVIATWKDPASGEAFLGRTPIFKVGAGIPEDLKQEG